MSSKRFFINNIDTFLGQNILKELVKEDEEEIEPTIMATYTDSERIDKQRGVKKILKRYKPKLSKKKMIEECDVYIYDLHNGNIEDIKFGLDVIKNVQFEEEKTFILVSNVMSWGETPKKEKQDKAQEGLETEEDNNQQEDDENHDKEENEENEEKEEEEQEDVEQEQEEDEENKNEDNEELDQENQNEQQQPQEKEESQESIKEYEPYKEEDYLIRVPYENYSHFKEIEDELLALHKKENLKVVVVCAGILYGQGELTFHSLFKAGWLQNPASLPYLDHGNNKIPTIHIQDLAKFIVKLGDSPPENLPYVFAFDNSQKKSQKEIVEIISRGVGSGLIESVQDSQLIAEEFIQNFKLDLDAYPSSLLIGTEENPVEFEWFCQNGLEGNVKNVLKEFEQKENLRPIKILLYFPQEELKELRVESIAQEISEHYRIPVLTLESIFRDAENLDQENLRIDYQELWDQVQEYLKGNEDAPSDGAIPEEIKIFIRIVKWRLNQNDCRNRGYILLNFPLFHHQARYIFTTFPKSTLKRIKIKPKALKRKTSNQNDDNDEEEEEEDNEEQEENQEENPEQEEEDNPEEENPEDEEFQSTNEPYFPESMMLIKRLRGENLQTLDIGCLDFFLQKNMDSLMYDPTDKTDFEIFESLRTYIERNGRPHNYLVPEDQLKQKFDEYYAQKDQEIINQKQQQIVQNQEQIENQKQEREKRSKEQVDYVFNNEFEDINQHRSFRTYLMEHVVPYLSEALIEVSTLRPEDPVDFLAENLYKKSFEL